MTANVRIITPNDGDSAALTASPALTASLPVTNLQDPSRARTARTTSAAYQFIKGTWSEAKVISACALVRHNLTSVGTWRLKLYSDAAWTENIYDSLPILAAPPKALGDLEWGVDPLGASLFTGWALAFSVMWFTPRAPRSFIIEIDDTMNPAGYLEASRLFIGRYLEPVSNFDWGIRLSWKEDTTQERTEGGTLRSDGFDPYRRMAFRLGWLEPTDRPKFMEWARKDGLRHDVFISAYPEEATALERDHSMAAKLIASPEIERRHVNTFGSEYIVEES